MVRQSAGQFHAVQMIRQKACAKVNLFLEITGKRPDGYHTLSTLFQTISLADELTLTPAEDLVLTCTDPILPTDERNIVMKAAMRLRDHLHEERGANIHLEKKIPPGGGLGGGSSDAAATLVGLLKLWGRRIPATGALAGPPRRSGGGRSELRQLAVQLGADVPFFLKGGLCRGGGIGDKLEPLKPLPKTWLVLVFPGFGVSTKDAYAKVKLPFADPQRMSKAVIARQSVLPKQSRFLTPRLLRTTPADVRSTGLLNKEQGRARSARNDCEVDSLVRTSLNLFNRFEQFVFPDHPELPALKQRLLDLGATGALMSGSGSSVFGLAKSKTEGENILAAVKSEAPQSWLVHTL